MDLRSLIRALGGATNVARRLGRSRQAVVNAVARGVLPAEWRFEVWRLALEAGLDWTPPGAEGLRDALRGRGERGGGPARQRRALLPSSPPLASAGNAACPAACKEEAPR